MSGFTYFVPGVAALADGDLERWRLRYAFDDNPAAAHISGRTPTGGGGLLLAEQARLGDRTFGYFPDEQKWRKRPTVDNPGGPDIYIGYYPAFKPQPIDLQRASVMRGERVKLGDGQSWLAPRILVWADEGGYRHVLPTKLDFDDDGELVTSGLVDDFTDLKPIVDRLYALMMTGESLKVAEAVDLASRLLQINYVVGKRELLMLGAIENNDSLSAIGDVAADRATALEWLKKNKPAKSPTP